MERPGLVNSPLLAVWILSSPLLGFFEVSVRADLHGWLSGWGQGVRQALHWINKTSLLIKEPLTRPWPMSGHQHGRFDSSGTENKEIGKLYPALPHPAPSPQCITLFKGC